MVTKNVLSQYVDLRKEMGEVRNKIKKLESDIKKIEDGETVRDTVTGGYGGTQHFKVEGIPVPEYSRKKTLLYARKVTLELLEIDLVEKTNDVEKFIASVDDSRVRRIINLRFLESKSWNEVADAIGGGNTENSVRMIFNRFMESCSICSEKIL